MNKTAVLNIVGLTPKLIGPATPKLAAWVKGATLTRVQPAFPAVTCSAQTNYLTGQLPSVHGIVGNGWYSREEAEVKFWKQSNALVQAPKIWDAARAIDPSFTCANLFWWFNMYSTADYSVTPRPMYPADGRKIPDVYTHPPDLRQDLQGTLGTFPLFDFWGPRAGITSTAWIAEAAKRVEQKFNATLSLVYLPHLDYDLQRLGGDPAVVADALGEIDQVAGDLIAFYESRGARVIVLSEYGIRDVKRPIHLNRVLRTQGLLTVRDERGLDVIDPGGSAAFAVADHQVAHVYVNDRSKLGAVRAALDRVGGIEFIWGDAEKAAHGMNHARSGDFILVAADDAWFTYYYWLDDRRAPDYARTVDIHRKPGYDPVELFLDPAIKRPPLTVGWKLLKRNLGFRSLLDVIPLNAHLVKGSHGRQGGWDDDSPVFISKWGRPDTGAQPVSTDVYGWILRHLTD